MRHATLLAIALAACGKGPESPAPPAPSPPPVEAPAAAAAPEDAAPPVDAAPATTASTAPEPPKDECAPVAAAYESSLRPKLKKCWLDAANKKKDVMIVGQVKYVVEIDGLGKIASMRQVEQTTLPNDVVACMTKVVKAEKLDTSKCTFKTLTVAEKFPR
jgi:hypothetical protein